MVTTLHETRKNPKTGKRERTGRQLVAGKVQRSGGGYETGVAAVIEKDGSVTRTPGAVTGSLATARLAEETAKAAEAKASEQRMQQEVSARAAPVQQDPLLQAAIAAQEQNTPPPSAAAPRPNTISAAPPGGVKTGYVPPLERPPSEFFGNIRESLTDLRAENERNAPAGSLGGLQLNRHSVANTVLSAGIGAFTVLGVLDPRPAKNTAVQVTAGLGKEVLETGGLSRSARAAGDQLTNRPLDFAGEQSGAIATGGALQGVLSKLPGPRPSTPIGQTGALRGSPKRRTTKAEMRKQNAGAAYDPNVARGNDFVQRRTPRQVQGVQLRDSTSVRVVDAQVKKTGAGTVVAARSYDVTFKGNIVNVQRGINTIPKGNAQQAVVKFTYGKEGIPNIITDYGGKRFVQFGNVQFRDVPSGGVRPPSQVKTNFGNNNAALRQVIVERAPQLGSKGKTGTVPESFTPRQQGGSQPIVLEQAPAGAAPKATFGNQLPGVRQATGREAVFARLRQRVMDKYRAPKDLVVVRPSEPLARVNQQSRSPSSVQSRAPASAQLADPLATKNAVNLLQRRTPDIGLTPRLGFAEKQENEPLTALQPPTTVTESVIAQEQDTEQTPVEEQKQEQDVETVPDVSFDFAQPTSGGGGSSPQSPPPPAAPASQPPVPPPITLPQTGRPGVPPRLPSPVIELPGLPVLPRPRNNPRGSPALFAVEVGRRGNKVFMNLGVGDIDKVLKGRSAVQNTAAATVRIRPLTPAAEAVNLRDVLGPDFRPGKRGGFVQRSEKRISSRGEKAEIPGESKRKGKKKKITEGFGFSQAVRLQEKGFSLRNIRKRFGL